MTLFGPALAAIRICLYKTKDLSVNQRDYQKAICYPTAAYCKRLTACYSLLHHLLLHPPCWAGGGAGCGRRWSGCCCRSCPARSCPAAAAASPPLSSAAWSLSSSASSSRGAAAPSMVIIQQRAPSIRRVTHREFCSFHKSRDSNQVGRTRNRQHTQL